MSRPHTPSAGTERTGRRLTGKGLQSKRRQSARELSAGGKVNAIARERSPSRAEQGWSPDEIEMRVGPRRRRTTCA
jgi:hypothetical protein